MSKPPAPAEDRFELGGYYLERTHPEHGGAWYACRYDARTRNVRRRSLGTSDFEQAKTKLAGIVATAPQITRSGAPGPDQVLTLAVLQTYLDGHASGIASEEQAQRAVTLIAEYLASTKRTDAVVAFWSPAQQLEFARWCVSKHKHAAGTVARNFNVMRSAFIDACEVKMRLDAVGAQVECGLIHSAPKIVMTRETIAAELKIPLRKPRRATLSIEQMAAAIDTLNAPHLRRFAIMSLCTWARPQAVTDFDPDRQVDWFGEHLDLAPPDWIRTNKRRSRQPLTQCLAGWLPAWAAEDAKRRARDLDLGLEPVEPGLLIYKRKRVASVKRAIRKVGPKIGIEGFTQKTFRHFMTDQVKKLFRGVPRELRSLWLGHVVRDGSRTTDNYEGDDPDDLADVALATDAVIALVSTHTQKPLFAVEPLLKRAELKAIGARVLPKTPILRGAMVGATGIEPVTPTMSR